MQTYFPLHLISFTAPWCVYVFVSVCENISTLPPLQSWPCRLKRACPHKPWGSTYLLSPDGFLIKLRWDADPGLLEKSADINWCWGSYWWTRSWLNAHVQRPQLLFLLIPTSESWPGSWTGSCWSREDSDFSALDEKDPDQTWARCTSTWLTRSDCGLRQQLTQPLQSLRLQKLKLCQQCYQISEPWFYHWCH